MNWSVLVLIAIPLVIFLVFMLREVGSMDAAARQARSERNAERKRQFVQMLADASVIDRSNRSIVAPEAQPEGAKENASVLPRAVNENPNSDNGEGLTSIDERSADAASPETEATGADSTITHSTASSTPKAPSSLPMEGTPGFAFDYRGRLWVEKKRRGFFRQLRRPNLPPDDPDTP